MQGPDANTAQGVPFVRQSSDHEGSGLEKLRRFTADQGVNELEPVMEGSTCSGDQNTSSDGQDGSSIVPTSQTNTVVGVLSL
jgi:hypothetical protein